MKNLTVAFWIAAIASSAAAHSPLEKTTPANDAVVSEFPAELSLDFAGSIRLTRVDLVHQDQAPVQLDLGGQTGFAQSYTLPLQGMGAGTYRVEWRGLGADGHAMKGHFSFEVE
ncbi:copper resistance CopC family protein [Leisingera sp. ANG-Vp]|uniref:copper resistance CopC family protein n=1 Tax=Leisingera sp. ANG-Vp TaxID=1577896 RepID=UPI00057E6106|nr:copper resistance CopC family protein [Leisingera sp. ANG-Vp]KIC14826.1 copper resistance protein CopC [Leisingera sp. ANG-Vp]